MSGSSSRLKQDVAGNLRPVGQPQERRIGFEERDILQTFARRLDRDAVAADIAYAVGALTLAMLVAVGLDFKCKTSLQILARTNTRAVKLCTAQLLTW